MKTAIAILACTGIMAVYCLIGSVASGNTAVEVLNMIGLIWAIDATWHRIMGSKTLDGPSQRRL
jgi:hypothetical protein